MLAIDAMLVALAIAVPLPNARKPNFSFKSATKLGPQMVYELNEKSTI